MNGAIKISVCRAPSLIPGMVDAVSKAESPLILVPESFTLTTEQALVQASEERGFIGTQVFSQKSLIREIKERAGFPDKKVISSDGRHMILSLLLLKNKGKLLFYKENVDQISMAEKLASQIDDLTDGGFDCDTLEEAAAGMKQSTVYKCHDIALLWREYRNVLDMGYADKDSEWLIALERLESSNIFQGMDLIIYGFDYINMSLTQLITTAYPLVNSVTVGLISRTGGADDHIFEQAANSVDRFARRMAKQDPPIPVQTESFRAPQQGVNAGVAYIERNIYALGDMEKEVPDLSGVSVYYAPNTTAECLHTAQTLIEWHKQGIAWHDMAVAVCDDTTIPAMLPMILSSAGVPYARRSGMSMLLSEYAQYFVATLRCLRTGCSQGEVLRLIKSKFTSLSEDEMMDMENYARQYGIDHSRWLRPFKGDDEKTVRLEALRKAIMEPLSELKKRLSAKSCTGRDAAAAIFEHMMAAGAYDCLLKREQELIDAGMPETADRDRQVWTAVNDLLDQLAVFAANDHLSIEELCIMLESSICAKSIKSLPQVADSVIISSPNMFFSSGIRAVVAAGLQDKPSGAPSALLTPSECGGLVPSDEEGSPSPGIGMTRREAAARAKQDIYQAIACATERLMFSCSAAQANGKVLSSSQVYRNVEELVKKQHPENIRGGLLDDELLPFVPQFALERLAVMLRAAKDEQESFLTKDDPESRSWREALAYLYNDSAWHDRMCAVLDGLHVKIGGKGIPADLAVLLYGKNRLSVSAIETAGTCLYWAFLAYGLRIRQRRDFTFEADSQGTFSHEVLRQFFEQAVRHPEWPALSDKSTDALLDSIFSEQTRAWEDGPLGRNTSGRFQGEELIQTVRTAVHTMAKALAKEPHFRPVGMEIGFGSMSSESPMHFPAVALTLEDGREIFLSGKIDRVDTVELSDGRKAVLVYDFKSNDKEVHGDALDAGLQIQLPIYLAAVEKGMPDHIIAGALYQPVKEVLTDARDEDIEKIEASIEKALQSKGIYLDDDAVKQAAAPVKIPSRKSTTDLINVLSEDGLRDVMERGKSAACDVVGRMFAGITTPNPLQGGATSPCEYCGNKGACPIDPRLDGGRVRKLESSDKEEE